MPRTKSLSREAALDTLAELFLERGYTLPIREIADALGVSRSTIYGTFGARSELFASVLHRYGPARVPGLRVSDAPSPRAALVRVFEPEITAEAPRRCLVLDTIVRMPVSSSKVTELVDVAIEDLQDRFVATIERGQSAGEIAGSVGPSPAAAALLSLYLGRYLLVHSGAAKESVQAAVARGAQALLPPPT